MGRIKEKIEKALQKIAWQKAEINTDQITFSEEVLKACEANYCGKYNTNWTCPPGAGKPEDLRRRYTAYKKAFVYTTKHEIEDSFDIVGMLEAGKVHAGQEDAVLKALAGEDIKMLGASACQICKKCTYPDAPCRFPERSRPSVEACGINVVDLSAKCGINYINGENTVTYFSIIFYNE